MAYNDITGDALVSRTLTDEGAKSFDRIFGEKKKTNGGWTPPPLPEYSEDWQSEQRATAISQNGNDGLHYNK